MRDQHVWHQRPDHQPRHVSRGAHRFGSPIQRRFEPDEIVDWLDGEGDEDTTGFSDGVV